MIKELINNLSPAPSEALELIATDAALLDAAIARSRKTQMAWDLVGVRGELTGFAKRVRDRSEIVGAACAARILSSPIPDCQHQHRMLEVDLWIEGVTKKIATEIERRERKQFFAVAVLAPLISVIVSGISVAVAMVGILVSAIYHR